MPSSISSGSGSDAMQQDEPLDSPRFPDPDEDMSEMGADTGTANLGYKKTVTAEGKGWEKPGRHYDVTISYTAKLADGTVVDEASELLAQLDSGALCVGLDRAIKTMKKGEKATIEIENAFGEEGKPDKGVPPGASVTYDVELVSWVKAEDVSEAQDGSAIIRVPEEPDDYSLNKPRDEDVVVFTRRFREGGGEWVDDGKKRAVLREVEPRVLRDALAKLKATSRGTLCVTQGSEKSEHELHLEDVGKVTDINKDGGVVVVAFSKKDSSWKTPNETDTVGLTFSASAVGDPATHDERSYARNAVKFTIGAAEIPVPFGLELGLAKLVKGQPAEITVRADYARGHALCRDVPEGGSVVFRVCIEELEESKSLYSLSRDERREWAARVKAVGNEVFKTDARRALVRYEKALDCIKQDDHAKDKGPEHQELKTSLHLNMAACCEKLGDWVSMLSHSNKALEASPSHAKARFRKAKAHMQLGDHDIALTEVQRLLEVDNGDKAVLALQAAAKKARKAQDARDKALFSKMFSTPMSA